MVESFETVCSEALENGLLPNNGVIVGDDAFPLQRLTLRNHIQEQTWPIMKECTTTDCQELGEYPKMDLGSWLVDSEYSRNL